MRLSASFIALASPLLVLAAPMKFTKRVAATDILVLQFADVLEQLESTFYSQALTMFQDSNFLSAGFSAAQIPLQQIEVIQVDESTHSTVLQSALQSLGEQPITSCKFDFSSVLTDVTTMAATARLVENVGVGAYLGGAALIADPQLLNAAATILTVEARHQTVLNILGGASAIPQAFDIPLTPEEVLAIASPFISGCDLGIQANPTLTITTTETITVGTKLTFSSSALGSSSSQSQMSCQMLAGGMAFSISLPMSNCVVPSGINGPVAIYITSDDQPILSDIVVRQNSTIVAGPTVVFIDTVIESLGQVVRPALSGSASASTTTQTISPQAAESIVASASGSASPSSSTGSSSNNSGSSSNISGSSNNSGYSSNNSGSGYSMTSSLSAAASGVSAGSASSPSPSASVANNAAAPGFTGSADGGAVTVDGSTNVTQGSN